MAILIYSPSTILCVLFWNTLNFHFLFQKAEEETHNNTSKFQALNKL